MRKYLLVVGCFLCSSLAQAASFDCTKAQTYSEKAICQNQTLSQEDDQLGSLYKQLIEKTDNLDVLKTIARGNLALRNQCENLSCLENWFKSSFALYEYLLSAVPGDSLSEYPKEVQKICKHQETTVDMLKCGEAQLNYEQMQLEANMKKVLKAANTQKQKQEVEAFYSQWKADRYKYCSLEFNDGGKMDSLKISGCFLTWTKDLFHKTKDADSFIKGLTSSEIEPIDPMVK